MGSRVYVGRLSYRAHERDIERFFRGYGRITEILLKNGYAFVEFSDRRDAEDAVHDLNGRSLLGDRVIVQNAKSRPRGRDMYRERLRERSRSRERRRSHNRRRSHSRDRKKRKHSSSDSDSLADNRRRSSSRSLSQSPRKSIKKAVSGKRRRHDRSSSSRSRSPEDRKYKDKRKEPKYRSSSETEGSVDRSEGNKHKIIVRGFDSRGKFAKRLKHAAKKYGHLMDFKMRSDNSCVISYTSTESVKKALEKMSGKEIDGQTVQVAAFEEDDQVAVEGKDLESTKELKRSSSEERSRSRTKSGSSTAVSDDEKNGDVYGSSHLAGSSKKVKNGGEQEDIASSITATNSRKRTSAVHDGNEKNSDDSEATSGSVTPNLKKKRNDTDEIATPEVDSTASIGAD